MTYIKSLSSSKHQYLWVMLLALVVASMLYYNSLNVFQVGVYMDDASYVALARSLVEKGVYGYTNVPGELHLTRYPFGFPLLLVPVAKLFSENLTALQLTSLAITLINGWLLYRFGSYFGWGDHSILRLSIPILYLFSPLISGHAIMVMSEAAFTLWVLLTLFLLSLILNSDNLSIIYSILLSSVVFAAATTRTLGYPLIIIVLIFLGVAKKYRQMIVFGLGFLAIFAIAWIVLPVNLQDFGLSVEYGRQLREARHYEQVFEGNALLIRILSLLWLYLTEGVHSVVVSIGGVGSTSRAVLGEWGLDFITTIIGLFTSGLIAIGMMRTWRSYPIPFVYTVIYCGSLLIWPFYLPRFLYPVLPFLCYYLLCGIEYIMGAFLPAMLQITDKRRDRILYVSVSIISLILLVASVFRSLPRDTSLNHTIDLEEGINWIKSNTASDVVIMSENTLTAFIYADRSVVGYPSDLENLLNKIEYYGVDYLLIRPRLQWSTPRYLEFSNIAQGILTYVQTEPDIFTLVYSNPAEKTYVYRVTPP